MSNWRDVHKGFVVEGGGAHWTVLDRKPGQVFTISSPGRKTWTGERKGEVVIVSQPAPQEDPRVQLATAQGLIATKFGGIEIGKQDRDKSKPWKTPVEYVDPGSLLAHLRIFHNAMSEEPSLAGLVKVHADLHGPQHKANGLYEPHVHDPDYEEL